MKFNIKNLTFLILPAFLGLSSCTIEEIADPNGQSVSALLEDASRGELVTVASGVESLMREEIGFYYDVSSIIGRDYYFFTGSDPRYTGELLGKEASVLDPAGFYGTRPFAGRYRTVKMTNILITAVQNSSADLSNEEREGYYGFAKTIQAYELHLVLMLQYQNGIRTDVADPDNLGPFRSYDESLAFLADLLEQGATHLENAGAEFAFTLSPGFDGFNTPATFLKFNRASAARIAAYQNNKSKILKLVGDSFMDMVGDFYTGPYRYYSTAGGEVTNNLFRPTDQSEAIIAHSTFLAALDPADDRNGKIQARTAPLTLDGLTGTHDVVVFNSLSAPNHFIRNEELILLFAEGQIGSDNNLAVGAIDVVRKGHGLGGYAGGTSDAELLDEVLAQRRLSLFAEGHRWIDMRRFGRLASLPIDRADDNVWEQMPRPDTEE